MARGLGKQLRLPTSDELFQGRLLALDGLRALAIAGVLAMHANEKLPGGHLGVSVFFVLSGYIITTSLLAERRRRGAVDLFAFYVRRFARLSPPLVVAILAAAVLALARGVGPSTVVAAVVSTLLYVSNFVRTILGNKALTGFGWTWTLSLEEQFYLFWPGLLLLTIRRSRLWSLAAAGIGVVVPLALRFFLPTHADPAPVQLYYGPHSRVSGLMLGCALALLLAHRRPRSRPSVATAGLCGSLAMIVLGYVFAKEGAATTYTIWLPLVELASAVAVTAIVAAPEAAGARLLSLRPVAFLGLISYGLYLWNATVLDNMRAAIGLSLPSAFLWLAVTVAVSAASYFWLETPIRERARDYLRARQEPAVSTPEPVPGV